MRFSGITYDHDRDGKRLGGQMKAVMELLLNAPHERFSLKSLSQYLSAPEASVSARLRDMRKQRFGSHDIRREYIEDGLWLYWYEPPEGQTEMAL